MGLSKRIFTKDFKLAAVRRLERVTITRNRCRWTRSRSE